MIPYALVYVNDKTTFLSFLNFSLITYILPERERERESLRNIHWGRRKV